MKIIRCSYICTIYYRVENKIRKFNVAERKMLEEAAVDSYVSELSSDSPTSADEHLWLAEKLSTMVSCSSISDDSIGVIHYVAGSIGRSVARVHK